jgi:hypothetical protein
MPRVMTKTREDEANSRWPIALILVAAFLVRAYGIGYVLPHPMSGEEQRVVKQAIRFTTEGVRPKQFDKPVLMSYILAGEYGAVFGVGHVFGRFKYVYDYEGYFLKKPALFYILGRLTSVFFGLLGIYMVYLLCRTALEWGIGVMAAAILAVEPHNIEMCRTGTGEAIAFFFLLAGLYFLANIEKEGRMGSVLVGALFVGFAASVSYYYAVFVVFLYVAYLATIPSVYKPAAWIFGLFATAITFLFGMLLPNGMMLLSWREFAGGVFDDIVYRGTTGNLSNFASAGSYLKELVGSGTLADGLGWGLAGAGAVGLVWGLAFAKWSRPKFFVILALAAVGGVLLFPWSERSFATWAFVMSAPLAIGAAYLVYRMCWRRWMPTPLAMLLMVVLTAGVAAQTAIQTELLLTRKNADDTRYQFAEWAQGNLPHLSRILVTPETDWVLRAGALRGGNSWALWREDILSAWNHHAFQIRTYPIPFRGGKMPVVANCDYAVTDSWTNELLETGGPASRRVILAIAKRIGTLAEPVVRVMSTEDDNAKELLSQLAQAKSSGEVVKTFAVQVEQPKGYGPAIEVIKLAATAPATTPAEGGGTEAGQGPFGVPGEELAPPIEAPASTESSLKGP